MECRICGNAASPMLYEAREMMYGTREPFTYFQCSKCLCLQIKDIPVDMERHYRGGYYSYEPVRGPGRVTEYFMGLRDRNLLVGKSLAGRLLRILFPAPRPEIFRTSRLRPESRILEVGCGSGAFLYPLRGAGLENVLGVDPYIPGNISYRNGLNIRKMRIGEVTGMWDVILFLHSFEHLPDPEETLRNVHRLLVPGGACMIRIPTVSSYAWKHYGVNWVQLDAPRHSFLHSVESVRLLCGKVGLELTDITCDSTAFQFWGSEQYLLEIPLTDPRSYSVDPSKSLFTKEDIAGFTERADRLNAEGQGDQSVFFLRKP